VNRRPSDHRLRRAPNKNLPSSRRVSSREGNRSTVSLGTVRRELDELRHAVEDIRAELSARLQPLTATPTGNDNPELCHAIHEIYRNALSLQRGYLKAQRSVIRREFDSGKPCVMRSARGNNLRRSPAC
jgi:hypothetical protein